VRINVYAEEILREGKRVEQVKKTAENGKTFFGARLYLHSPGQLHDTEDDDDRSAITIWGPRAIVADLLRELANTIDPEDERRG
jgi:hypothetical protein